MIRAALTILIVCGLVSAALAYGVFTQMTRVSGPLEKDTLVYIAPGTSVNAMAQQLKDSGAVDAAWVFKVAARLRQRSGVLKAGEYMIPRSASTNDIITLLQSGKTYLHRLTIPEGLMSFEIVNIVNNADALEGTIADIPADGSLLPETYSYSRGDTRQSIINEMQSDMARTLSEVWAQRDTAVPVGTPEQAVTLASVVEKETGVAAERPRVAGVFVNRLKAGMPLQSDPTVIYAVTEGKSRLERPIYRKDLNSESPFNTYIHTGLPPAPIANPGRASLEAVLHPEGHDYFYFVADGTGGHAFAHSLDEHDRNVSKWRTVEKNRVKTPPTPAPAAAPAVSP